MSSYMPSDSNIITIMQAENIDYFQIVKGGSIGARYLYYYIDNKLFYKCHLDDFFRYFDEKYILSSLYYINANDPDFLYMIKTFLQNILNTGKNGSEYFRKIQNNFTNIKIAISAEPIGRLYNPYLLPLENAIRP